MSSNSIVNDSDKRKGIIVSISVILILFIYLKFAYFLMADPPPKVIPVKTSLNIPQELEIQHLKVEGGGSGTPKDAPITKEPQTQTEKLATKSESRTEINTGQSNSTNSPNSQNEASTTSRSNNPFGSGGSGGGNSSGNGRGFGNDTGDGIGKGDGDGGKPLEPRIRLTEPEVIESNQSGIVHLRVTINAEGNVIQVSNLTNQTTITDQRIINQVVSMVKSKIKYNKKPGTRPQSQTLQINVKAT
jgi:hypothetical protein